MNPMLPEEIDAEDDNQEREDDDKQPLHSINNANQLFTKPRDLKKCKSVAPRKSRPEIVHRETRVDAFVAKPECLVVEYVTLEPNLGRQGRPEFKLTVERPRVDEHFQFQLFQIEVG